MSEHNTLTYVYVIFFLFFLLVVGIFRAAEIIRLHKNPIQTIGAFGNKIFIPDNSEVEKEHVKNCLDALKEVLEAERVERRSSSVVVVLKNL